MTGEPFGGNLKQAKEMIENQRKIIADHENTIRRLTKDAIETLLVVQNLRSKEQKLVDDIRCKKEQLRALQNAINYIARKV